MPNIKVTREQASIIKKRLFAETQENGIVRTCQNIAAEYNLHWQTIYWIWSGRRWADAE